MILEDKEDITNKVMESIPVVMRSGILGSKQGYFIRELLSMAYRLGVKHAQEEKT